MTQQGSWTTVVLGLILVMAMGVAAAEEPGGEPSPDAEPAPERAAGSEESADEPPVNTLKWTTASEVDNFGFDIYRGLSEEGPFERITDEPLPGAGTTDEPQSYVFVDEDIDPARDYFYYIESISLGGVREIFSPVIRAPAKQVSASGDGGE